VTPTARTVHFAPWHLYRTQHRYWETGWGINLLCPTCRKVRRLERTIDGVRVNALDDCLRVVFATDPINYTDQANAYRKRCAKAPRLVLAWHHIRMGLRVLTSGKALP